MKRPRFRKVYCEISNSCNLSCDFCPSAADSGVEKRFMSEELFAKLVPQLKPLTYALCLHVMGEPTYHPNLGRFLDICEEHKMKVSIVTNGTLMSEKHQQLLMHPAVMQINFSLQSFESNFPELSSEKYLKKILDFVKRTLTERPDLHINFRLWNSDEISDVLKENEHTISQIKEYFDIPDEVINNLSHRGNKLKGDLYLNLAERFDWPTMDMPVHSERGTCPALKNQFGILSDGTVIPCCLDKDGVVNLGNCNENTLDEILNSERALAMREGFRMRNLVEPLCQRCTFNKRFK